MTQNLQLAQSYIQALTGSVDTVMDFRCIHDKDKSQQGRPLRGTLAQCWNDLVAYNNQGWGVFCVVNNMDGAGLELKNVHSIRAQFVDLDDTISAQANYERACSNAPAPHFAVQSSPGKFHVYWLVEQYAGNDFFSMIQRKLLQLYGGDKMVVDATRLLRVPGFYHLKAEPFLVNCWGISNTPRISPAAFEQLLQNVQVINAVSSPRVELGDPELAAPSLDWLKRALSMIDPNGLPRDEWVSTAAAIKQSGWSHTDEQTLQKIWMDWCAQYSKNDVGENLKVWRSIRETNIGWPSFLRRVPVIAAEINFGHPTPPTTQHTAQHAPQPQIDTFGEVLGPNECQKWFDGCFFIAQHGKIFDKTARLLDQGKFNGMYGGKQFVITSTGKSTDDAWKAALKSTMWTITKVDHLRFLPSEPPRKVVEDELGRTGINTYLPARIHMQQGDVSLFLDWLARILPDKNDQYILCSYLAHCVKYPGFKIPWCPLIQGAKGIGKTVIEEIMTYSLGAMYVYTPPASELIKSGSTFNAWMKERLMIFVDEIKIDERRELAEILKPFISQHRIQMQSKGVDQQMEDNPANWVMFSNYKDCFPIDEDERRYSMFFSALQTAEDIIRAGMDKDYFVKLWSWLREGGGKAAIAYWLNNFPIEKGGLDIRAPRTSSTDEAIRISRSPMEVVIADSVADGIPGFRGGYISSIAVAHRVKLSGIRMPGSRSIESCLEKMGFMQIGRAIRPYAQEDVNNRAIIFSNSVNLPIEGYGYAQGYE